MKSRKSESENPLEPVDVSRRKVVKVALAASAVAVPVISSVALGGVSPAFAESPNISGQTTTVGTTRSPADTTGSTESPTTTVNPDPTEGTTTGTTTLAPTTTTTLAPPTANPTDTTVPTVMPTEPA